MFSLGSLSGSSVTEPEASVPPASIVGASLVPVTVTVRVDVADAPCSSSIDVAERRPSALADGEIVEVGARIELTWLPTTVASPARAGAEAGGDGEDGADRRHRCRWRARRPGRWRSRVVRGGVGIGDRAVVGAGDRDGDGRGIGAPCSSSIDVVDDDDLGLRRRRDRRSRCPVVTGPAFAATTRPFPRPAGAGRPRSSR